MKPSVGLTWRFPVCLSTCSFLFDHILNFEILEVTLMRWAHADSLCGNQVLLVNDKPAVALGSG